MAFEVCHSDEIAFEDALRNGAGMQGDGQGKTVLHYASRLGKPFGDMILHSVDFQKLVISCYNIFMDLQ